MSQIFNAVPILCMPSVCGQVTWMFPDDCPPPVFGRLGRRVWSYPPPPCAQNCSGSPCACCSPSRPLSPFCACGPSLFSIFSAFPPSCGTTAFLLKCKAVLRSLLHVRYKTSFLFPWDRKLHVRWNNQVSMTHVSYTTKPDPIIKFPQNGNKTQISLALCK